MDVKKILKIAIPLGLGGFLVWYSFTIVSPGELLEYFKEANYSWVFLGLFFGMLSHLSRAYRWKYLLEPMGYKPDFINSVMAVLVAYLMNIFIPRGGEVTRAAVMTNYEKIPFEKGFGTIVAERIADLVMMFIVILITLFFQFDFIYNLLLENFNPLKVVIAIIGIIIGVYLFRRYLKNATSGLGFKIKNFLLSLSEGVTSIFKMKNKWPFILHTIFIWIMYVVMFWATVPAIDGLTVPFGGVLVGFLAGGFAITATNGGLGAYPAAVGGALTLFGIASKTAIAFGSVMWAAQTVMIIIFGGLAFLLLPVYNKNK